MPEPQFTDCLPLLHLIEDLFTETPHEMFTRDAILVILNGIKHDPRLLDPVVVEEWEKNA